MKVCSEWVYLEVSCLVLCTFMKVYMLPERFFGYFPPIDFFWAIFDNMRGYILPFWDHFWRQNRTKIGSFWGDFGPFLGRSIWFWGHLAIILASFWHHLLLVLVSFWPHFWTLFGHLLRHFFAISSRFFGVFLRWFRGIFSDVLGSWLQH